MLFIHYPKCSTCRKANKWLNDKGLEFTERDIVSENPTTDELRNWIEISGLDIKKFFNTSGIIYREMGLKDKLPTMSFDEKINLLSSNGMLVKRPILVMDSKVLVGFKEAEWEKLMINNK